LGIWIVKGWNEVVTDPTAVTQWRTIRTGWAQQDSNGMLKKLAGESLSTTRSSGGAR
jgi:hypothetical protein